MKKRKLSILFNELIVIFEIIALIISLKVNHKIGFEYYTEQSNILALCSSFVFLIFLFRKKQIPKWLSIFKYISTVSLTVTFSVVILILAPMYNFNYIYLLFYGSLLFVHFICPIISVITFLFFDELDFYNKKDSVMGISYTIIYAIVMITLNYLRILEGPYPFLMVYKQSVYMSILWLILILLLAYFLSFLLRFFRNKRLK